MFRGREITHPQIGRGRIHTMMERLEAEEGLPLTVEKNLGMEGRFMSVIVAEDKVRAAALLREQAEQAAAEAEDGTSDPESRVAARGGSRLMPKMKSHKRGQEAL